MTIWIAIIALLGSCFIAACNGALKFYRRSKLTDMMEAADKGQRLETFHQRLPHLQLVTATVRAMLNLIVLLAILLYVEQAGSWDPWWGKHLLAFGVAGLAVIIFSVAIPLSLARHQPEQMLARSMVLLNAMEVLFRPVTAALHLFDPIVRRISGAERLDNDNEPVSEKIMTVVEDEEAEGTVDPAQKEMIEAVFDLTQTTAGGIMTPRTEVTGIPLGTGLDEIKQIIQREGHSRIPVYEGNLDKIVGFLYAKDLLQFLGDGHTNDFKLRSILREALIVPETKSIRQLLGEFKARKVHMAIVLDEYGGTAGLITIEDILEELVGEIRDEYEPPADDPEIRMIDEKTYEVDARVHVDDLNDDLSIELPEDEDYDTVGGFVFSTLGHIPDVGEKFEFANARFTVTDAERTRVNRVRIELPSSPRVKNNHGNGNGS